MEVAAPRPMLPSMVVRAGTKAFPKTIHGPLISAAKYCYWYAIDNGLSADTVSVCQNAMTFPHLRTSTLLAGSQTPLEDYVFLINCYIQCVSSTNRDFNFGGQPLGPLPNSDVCCVYYLGEGFKKGQFNKWAHYFFTRDAPLPTGEPKSQGQLDAEQRQQDAELAVEEMRYSWGKAMLCGYTIFAALFLMWAFNVETPHPPGEVLAVVGLLFVMVHHFHSGGVGCASYAFDKLKAKQLFVIRLSALQGLGIVAFVIAALVVVVLGRSRDVVPLSDEGSQHLVRVNPESAKLLQEILDSPSQVQDLTLAVQEATPPTPVCPSLE